MATEYLTTDIDLKKVADGIRSRTGKTTPLAFPDGYVTEISTLTNTSDATATASDIAKTKTAYVNGTKVTGTVETVGPGEAYGTTTPSVSVSGNYIMAEDELREDFLLRKDSLIQLKMDPMKFGLAQNEEVLAGKSFTSMVGFKAKGTMPNNGAAAIQLSDLTAKPVTAGYYSGGTAKVADAEAAKIIPENIKKGITIFGVAGSMSGTEMSIVVTVTSGAVVTATKGSTTVSGTSVNGICTLTVPEAGTWSVKATLNGQTSDTKSVSVVDSYALTFNFVSYTLNDNEWSVIKSVSDARQGANYWSIGDRKAVTLNGTVGKLSLSNVTTYAFIIGFNHNASVEGTNRIHFQLAKTALTGGTDVCFCDNQYAPDGELSSPGAGYFVMNASNTNSGGWKSSQMRTNICGTSLSSYSGTIIAVIPVALRDVLKSVTKYTDNTGGGSTAVSNVTATTDYFFLLSEYEVFGRISRANSNEKNKQAQYAYYSAGNSKIKYKHNGTSTAAYWWLRSPYASNSYRFVNVNDSGNSGSYTADYSIGFAPGFCV